MRAGRITASRFKAACHTDHSNPSISLIMNICHPELSKFKNLAACWGCEHELTARKKYTTTYAISHHKFEVKASGFFINTDYPFIGATPDGLVTCTCCGDGICEIKVRCFYIYVIPFIDVYLNCSVHIVTRKTGMYVLWRILNFVR